MMTCLAPNFSSEKREENIMNEGPLLISLTSLRARQRTLLLWHVGKGHLCLGYVTDPSVIFAIVSSIVRTYEYSILKP